MLLLSRTTDSGRHGFLSLVVDCKGQLANPDTVLGRVLDDLPRLLDHRGVEGVTMLNGHSSARTYRTVRQLDAERFAALLEQYKAGKSVRPRS